MINRAHTNSLVIAAHLWLLSVSAASSTEISQDARDRPHIAGYAILSESDFPEYFELFQNRPTLEIVAVYVPSDASGSPDFIAHEGSGRQIIISKTPFRADPYTFARLREAMSEISDVIDKGQTIQLGVGVEATVVDFVPPTAHGENQMHSGMIFALSESDDEVRYQASFTLVALVGDRIYRIDAQESFESEVNWYKNLKERSTSIAADFLGVEPE